MKSAQHHWWPRSLSRFWSDAEGGVHRVSWDGQISRARPSNFGAVTNAHHVKLADVPTVWDETFEPEFGEADGSFPYLVDWLQFLETVQRPEGMVVRDRMLPHLATDQQFNMSVRCLVSLVVRSPSFRGSVTATTEYYRERLGIRSDDGNESHIALNLRDAHQRFLSGMLGRGKIAILSSHSAEFIFGDGFFHNFASPATAPFRPRILVPLTPHISVLYVRPIAYSPEPRILTMSLLPSEVKFLNDTIQVYSKDQLFYRREKPELIDEFRTHQFREYEFGSHPALEDLERVMTQTTFA